MLICFLVASVSAQTLELGDTCYKTFSCNSAKLLCCSDLYTDPYFKLPVESGGITSNICISKLSKRGDVIVPNATQSFTAAKYYIRNACYPTYVAPAGAKYMIMGSWVLVLIAFG